jgi:adenine deaminase
MTKSILAGLALVTMASANVQSPAPGSSRGALAGESFAIRNVTVIPMTQENMLPSTTVLVQRGRIAAMGTNVNVPQGTPVIDGAGKFLIPGLADMHTHLFSDGEEVHDSAGPAELGVMLAAGVTAARLMIGTPEHLALRKGVIEGRVIGPQLWVASPQFTGRPSENRRRV